MKHSILKNHHFALLLMLSFTLSGCQLASESEEEAEKVIVENDTTVLGDRVSYTDEVIAIETGDTVSPKPGFAAISTGDKAAEISLTLVAEVSAPAYGGQTLQATDVRILGNKAYVTYNMSGDIFLGAIEVYDITAATAPVLLSSAIFTDTDINGVAIHGNDLYLAGASNSTEYDSPAVLKNIKLSGGVLTDSVTTIDMPSYAATDVETAGSFVYVTTGADDGYVVVLNSTDLSEHTRVAAIDARGVDSDSADVAIVTGTNGVNGASANLVTFDRTLGTVLAEHNLSGATIKHSKSTIEVKKSKAILGMGDGGTQVVCLATGAVLKEIPVPVVEGLDVSLAVTNAATAYKRSLFMGNGEAGVYVAISDANIDSNQCSVDTLDLVGKLKLDTILVDGNQVAQSVNHILYRQDMLFIAAGLGGLKIIHVDDSAATTDDDDA